MPVRYPPERDVCCGAALLVSPVRLSVIIERRGSNSITGSESGLVPPWGRPSHPSTRQRESVLGYFHPDIAAVIQEAAHHPVPAG